jgi:hypothetical protein
VVPSSASSKVFFTPCQKPFVKTSFISSLARPSWYLVDANHAGLRPLRCRAYNPAGCAASRTAAVDLARDIPIVNATPHDSLPEIALPPN